MVLRSRATPGLLNTSGQRNVESSSSASPTSLPSPRRFSRRRARSTTSSPSPQQAVFPEQQDPVFSPDLHTSPAFDLMPLDQAQRSPAAASSSSHSDDAAKSSASAEAQLNDQISSGRAGTSPTGDLSPLRQSPIQIQSNNPFLKNIQLDESAAAQGEMHLRDSHATDHSESLNQGTFFQSTFPRMLLTYFFSIRRRVYTNGSSFVSPRSTSDRTTR